MRRPIAVVAAAALLAAAPLAAQAQHDPRAHAAHAAAGAAAPTAAGQAAFGALAEVVRILEADPATDWSRVNLAALREHLIDMDEVTLRATVTQRAVPGGLAADVTGSGRTLDAVRRMLPAHAAQLDADPRWSATTTAIPDGVRLTVRAADAADAALVTRLRALGVVGLLVQGDHHGPHHLMIARGGHH